MPLIRIDVLEGSLADDKKQEMITRVSEIVAEIEARPHAKEKLLPYVTCLINEVPPQHWGIGGKSVSLETLKSILEG